MLTGCRAPRYRNRVHRASHTLCGVFFLTHAWLMAALKTNTDARTERFYVQQSPPLTARLPCTVCLSEACRIASARHGTSDDLPTRYKFVQVRGLISGKTRSHTSSIQPQHLSPSQTCRFATRLRLCGHMCSEIVCSMNNEQLT